MVSIKTKTFHTNCGKQIIICPSYVLQIKCSVQLEIIRKRVLAIGKWTIISRIVAAHKRRCGKMSTHSGGAYLPLPIYI